VGRGDKINGEEIILMKNSKLKIKYHYNKCDDVVKCPCGLSNNNCPLDSKDIKIISVKNNCVTYEKNK